MLTSRADGRDIADEEGRDLAGQLRGPGDGVPGGRVDSAPPATRAAVLVREERADLGLSGIASAEDADPGRARARRVAEAVEDERWERTPRESVSVSFAA